MNFILRWCSVVLAIVIIGCGNINWRTGPIMAVPIQTSYEPQVLLNQLNYVLERKKLSAEEKIQLLFQRGMIYDGMGLTALAQNDFFKVLEIRPDIPEAYNYLGIYLANQGEFEAAYQAFDSALELDPDYEFAFFNRGVALYEATRYELAREDFQRFYENDTESPVRLLWVYLAEREINAKQAKKSLREHYDAYQGDKNGWSWGLIEFYLGDISEGRLMNRLQSESKDNKALAENLTEAYFYLGKYDLLTGDIERATTRFKLAIANNVYYYIEHRQAIAELTKLGLSEKEGAESVQ